MLEAASWKLGDLTHPRRDIKRLSSVYARSNGGALYHGTLIRTYVDSKLFPSPPPTLDDEARRAYENRPKAPARPKREKKPKTKQRPTGRKRVPEHLEAEEHTIKPEQCKECGGVDLELVDEVVPSHEPIPPTAS